MTAPRKLYFAAKLKCLQSGKPPAFSTYVAARVDFHWGSARLDTISLELSKLIQSRSTHTPRTSTNTYLLMSVRVMRFPGISTSRRAGLRRALGSG
jgi:hypothetical protein